MRIGFLGLGIMGQGMVMNLLRSGHEVTVWNRTTLKVGAGYSAGLEVIKLFSSSAQLSMKFQLLINIEIHVVEISRKFRFSTRQLLMYPAHKC